MSSPKLIKKAREDGKKAYLEGKPPQCPEELDHSSDERKSWFDGYYEARCVEKHQKTFEKYGIKYP